MPKGTDCPVHFALRWDAKVTGAYVHAALRGLGHTSQSPSPGPLGRPTYFTTTLARSPRMVIFGCFTIAWYWYSTPGCKPRTSIS